MKFIDIRGRSLPALGLGTWKSDEDEVYRAVKAAISVGYRHIDCAWIYDNESEVGRAVSECIDEGVVSRDDLWITSKLWNCFHHPENVREGLEASLEALQLDRLDLYLMHWPIAFAEGVAFPSSKEGFVPLSELPLSETWSAMEALVDAGLTHAIGVSNFTSSKLEGLLEDARITPAVNQVEMHPHLPQEELLAFCAEHGIHVTGYSPLGSPDRPERLREEGAPTLLEDPVIGEIAEARDVTPAQVLIAWALERGTSVIPKSVNPGRIQQNFEASEVSLSAEEMEAIAGIETRYRYVNPEAMFVRGVNYEGESFWS